MKVSLYIDEKLWRRFKETILHRAGTTKALSQEIELLVKDYIIDDFLIKGAQTLSHEPITPIPASEVHPITTTRPTSVNQVLKEMRMKRTAQSIP
ncbi:MAG: hypothetical protein HYU39_04745 [Thaumarchaeota archaeon]|nr:hypothetical protein [Nitrososphaerota archaeon]